MTQRVADKFGWPARSHKPIVSIKNSFPPFQLNLMLIYMYITYQRTWGILFWIVSVPLIGITSFVSFIKKLISYLDSASDLTDIADCCFMHLATSNDIDSNPSDFISRLILCMKTLQEHGKSNLLYKFAYCISERRPGTNKPLFPIDRMPFGLVEHQIEFFGCTNIMQVLWTSIFAWIVKQLNIIISSNTNEILELLKNMLKYWLNTAVTPGEHVILWMSTIAYYYYYFQDYSPTWLPGLVRNHVCWISNQIQPPFQGSHVEWCSRVSPKGSINGMLIVLWSVATKHNNIKH